MTVLVLLLLIVRPCHNHLSPLRWLIAAEIDVTEEIEDKQMGYQMNGVSLRWYLGLGLIRLSIPYRIFIITKVGTPGHDGLVHILCLSKAWPSISIKAIGRQTIWIQGTIDVYLFQCLHSVEESCYPGRMVLFMENSRNGTVHMMDPVFFCSGKPHPCRVFLPRLLSPPGILRCQCYKKTCAYLHIFSLFSYALIETGQ